MRVRMIMALLIVTGWMFFGLFVTFGWVYPRLKRSHWSVRYLTPDDWLTVGFFSLFWPLIVYLATRRR